MSRSVAIVGTRGYPSYYGGFETAVRRLAPYLVEHGWDVTVYGRPETMKLDDPGRDPRVHVRTTSGLNSRSLSTLSYGLTAAMDVARRKPDVALVMNAANGYWLPILRSAGIPTLVNVDGIEWARAKWGRFAKSVFYNGARMTARYGDRMVYDAHAIAAYWRQEFGLDGDFIPYGGDVPEPLELDEDGLRSRDYALVVARFVPENTVPEFLSAARRISQRADVVIVGSSGFGGELDDAARSLAAENPRVHWLGHVSDDRRLFSLWQHAGAYFHGHSVGGTNPALVQAMACGAPTVARDTVYNREVLGEAALFTEPQPDAIADAVIDLLDDPERQRQLSTAAKTRAVTDYSWAGVCQRYEDALLRLVGEKAARRPEEKVLVRHE
ncbi:glycosyltransferase [Rathayibacter sp. YIM 133350]|uniref:glycosyltransferase n=1 Tax=Rathayibacter sp. YIM 133350 TaxID=3131992 RepID=UPI00307D0680